MAERARQDRRPLVMARVVAPLLHPLQMVHLQVAAQQPRLVAMPLLAVALPRRLLVTVPLPGAEELHRKVTPLVRLAAAQQGPREQQGGEVVVDAARRRQRQSRR